LALPDRLGVGGHDNFCHDPTTATRKTTSGVKIGDEEKGSELAFAALWLVPSPRYFANFKLVRDRQQALASSVGAYQSDGAGRLLAYYAVTKCAVRLGPSLRADGNAGGVELVVGRGTGTL